MANSGTGGGVGGSGRQGSLSGVMSVGEGDEKRSPKGHQMATKWPPNSRQKGTAESAEERHLKTDAPLRQTLLVPMTSSFENPESAVAVSRPQSERKLLPGGDIEPSRAYWMAMATAT